MENINQTIEGQKDMAGTGKDAIIERLGLMSFASDGESLSPELIDDALESAATFYDTTNVADIASRIKANKDKYHDA
jgi:hypothetical protein